MNEMNGSNRSNRSNESNGNNRINKGNRSHRRYIICCICMVEILLSAVAAVKAYALPKGAVAESIVTDAPNTTEETVSYMEMTMASGQQSAIPISAAEVICVNAEVLFAPVVPEEAENAAAWRYYWSADAEIEKQEWTMMESEGVRIELTEGMHQILFCRYDEHGMQMFSEEYRICFDRTAPELVLETESNPDEWQREELACSVTASDGLSDIAVITCRTGDKLYWEQRDFERTGENQVKVHFRLSDETPVEGTEIELCATDRAGNSTILKQRYYLDQTAPKVCVDGIADGQLSAAAGALHIVIAEAVYEEAEAIFEISRLYEGTAQSLEHTACPLTAEETHFTRHFEQDGVYTVCIYARDRAGNVSDTVRLVFRVDVTAPLITLRGLRDDGLYCTEKELCIEVEEEFYQSDRVSVSVTRETPKQKDGYQVQPWSNQSKRTTQTYTFQEDGIYHVRVEAADEAGHAATQEIRFMIDRNAPHVTISGVEAHGMTSRRTVLRLESEELFYDRERVILSGSRSGMDGINLETAMPEFPCTAEHSELEYTVEEEGRYLIHMSAQDAVGNQSETQVSFTYDATPPQIGYLDQIDKTRLEQFKFPKDFDRYIQDLTEVSYKIYVNQQPFDESKSISEPGKYVVTVEAVDEAGNMAVRTAELIIEEMTAEEKAVSENSARIAPQRVPLQDRLRESTTTASDIGAADGGNVDTKEYKLENEQKKRTLQTCLLCGIPVAAGLIFAAWRRIDRKKDA